MRPTDMMKDGFTRGRDATRQVADRIRNARPEGAFRQLPLPQGVVMALVITLGVVMGTGQAITNAGQASYERNVLWTPDMTADRMALFERQRSAARERAIRKNMERWAAYRVDRELAEKIVDAAETHDIDPDIAFGLVRAESSFRNHATSVVGAVGLAQLMPRTASWMVPGTTVRDLRDPETNLDIGFMYLRYLLDKYDGSEDLALLAYNRGPGTVDRALRRGASPDNGYAAFVRGEDDHGHTLFSSGR